MKKPNFKFQISNFLIVFLSIFIWSDCMAAGDGSFAAPFGISHPDKKVSSPAVAAYDGKIYISYVREEGDVYITTLSADGKTMIAPVKINDKNALANGIHQSPGLAVGAKGEIYVTWTSPRQIQSGASPKEGDEFAADIRVAKSTDAGRTFLPSVAVNDNTISSSRGFESIAVAPDGAIFVAWLDGREKKQDVSSAYFSRSADGGRTFEKNIKLDGNACVCCRTAITSGTNGAVYVSWRKVSEGDIRDMVVASSSDNGRTFKEPVVVSRDQWTFNGCPHRGPSLAADDKGVLYYTWYTEGKEKFPAVYFSTSKDRGMTFAPRQPLPAGSGVFSDHSRLTVGKNGPVYLVWEEKTPVLSKIMFASYLEGKGFSKPEQLSQWKKSYEPLVIVADDGSVYVAWTSEIRVTKVVIRRVK